MNFVLTTGSAFIWDGHVWFILSDPQANRGEVLCVNLTSLDAECPDDECFLDHSDYGWIEMNHKTVVAFSRARIWNASKIQMAIAKGLIKCPTLNVVPKATVSKVIKAALASRELGADMKAFLL